MCKQNVYIISIYASLLNGLVHQELNRSLTDTVCWRKEKYEQTNLEWIRGSFDMIYSSKSFILTVGWLICVEQLHISCGSHSLVFFFSCFRFSSCVFSYLCNVWMFFFQNMWYKKIYLHCYIQSLVYGQSGSTPYI